MVFKSFGVRLLNGSKIHAVTSSKCYVQEIIELFFKEIS